MQRGLLIMLGVVGAGALALLLTNGKKNEAQDIRIDPDLGKHRGLSAVYGGPDGQMSVRLPDTQDPQGGFADYLGYNYKATQPSVYANDQWAIEGGGMESAQDRWAPVGYAPLDYGKPPVRVPALWKDNNRFWDAADMQGGVRDQQQSLHLFHLRPPVILRGARSISGSLNEIGGGQSTASTARVPAIFVPSVVS